MAQVVQRSASVPGGVMNVEAGGDYCTGTSFGCEREESEGSRGAAPPPR